MHATEPSFTVEVTDKPIACPLARHQAASGTFVTSRKHQLAMLDPIACHLLSQLDGTADAAFLLEGLLGFVKEKGIALQKDGSVIKTESEVREVLFQSIGPSLDQLQRDLSSSAWRVERLAN